MANSLDTDQTPHSTVWSGSTMFAQVWLFKNLGYLQYLILKDFIYLFFFFYWKVAQIEVSP